MNLSILAFIAGLAGLFLPIPFVPSVLAIRLGRKSEREDGSSGLARAGVILGWAGIVLWAISCCSLSVFVAMRVAAALKSSPALPPTEQPAQSGAYLGIQCSDRGGARVAGVSPGGPAEKAGLQPGDVILAVDVHGVVDCSDLASEIGKRTPGQTTTLKVWRSGETIQVIVTLEAR